MKAVIGLSTRPPIPARTGKVCVDVGVGRSLPWQQSGRQMGSWRVYQHRFEWERLGQSVEPEVFRIIWVWGDEGWGW